MEQDILSRIQMGYPTFSKGQKKIADYILEHYDKAAVYDGVQIMANGVYQRNRLWCGLATELGC